MASERTPIDVTRVFRGELDDLPIQQSKIVRVFLSSTFTDFEVERNVMLQDVFPQLRNYCLLKGLEFQVADMRWGVRDNAQMDHSTEKICLEEVAHCQRVSLGPNFVALLGSRYGYRPFPSEIEAEEFEILVRAALTISKDVSLLEQWYKKDENTVPTKYILQRITTIFPYYSDTSEENKDKREQAQKDWDAVQSLLGILFRDAALCAYRHGKFTMEQKQKYFMSVTESEVQHGILQAKNATNKTICFHRNFANIDVHSKMAGRFVDLEAGYIDSEAQNLLKELKELRIPRVLPREKMSSMTIPWTDVGVDVNCIEHVQYLENFKNDMLQKFASLLHQNIQPKSLITGNKGIYNEILHHAHFCTEKIKCFRGREEILSKIHFKMNKIYYREELLPGNENKPEQKYRHQMDDLLNNIVKHEKEATIIKEDSDDRMKYMKLAGVAVEDEMASSHEEMQLNCPILSQYSKPLIVYGTSGSGKTALMAQVVCTVNKWLDHPAVRITRFLGTSPQSSYIREVLIGICEQIWFIYGNKPPSMLHIGKDMPFLIQYFKSLLMRINTKEKPLVIVLDSLDQLHARDSAHYMTWLPVLLPPNVHLIVSVLPDAYGILDNLKGLIPDDDRYIEVSALGRDTAASILDLWLCNANRMLTRDQRDWLLARFKMSPQPMFLKLAFLQSLRWNSYTPRDQWILSTSCQTLIEQLFIQLEKDHGEILTSRALGYLTISKNGLSDSEMEDILSLDDDVLKDSYQYHLPPSKDVVRLPPLLWRRIRFDIKENLVEQKSDGKHVLRWYHRQYLEAAEKRYVDGKKVQLHALLVEYFSGKWFDKVRPIEFTLKKKGSFPNCTRGVAEQPLLQGKGVYNKRKLAELPYNLLACHNYGEYYEDILCNFEWLNCKLKAMGINDLLNDLHSVLQQLQQDVVKLQKEMEKIKKDKKTKGKADDDKGKVSAQDLSAMKDSIDPVGVMELDADIFKLTSQVPYTLSDLEEMLLDFQAVYDMLLLSSDALTTSAKSLSIQIIGQLQSCEDLRPCLAALLQQAIDFVESDSLALLFPVAKCLPSAGGELQRSFDISFCFPGDASELECKMAVSSHSHLYVVHHKTRPNNKNELTHVGDLLRVFNLTDRGTPISMENLHGMDVKWIEIVGGNRYLYLENYVKRDKFEPTYTTQVIDKDSRQALPFTPDTRVLSFSSTSRYCLMVDPYYRTEKGKHPTLAEQLKSGPANDAGDESNAVTDKELEAIEIAAIYDMDSHHKVSLKIQPGDKATKMESLNAVYGVFSPDASLVAMVSADGIVYCFGTDRGKLFYRFDGKENAGYMGRLSRQQLRNTMHILVNNMLIMPGTSYSHQCTLYVRNLDIGEPVRKLQSHTYAIELVVLNSDQSLCLSAVKSDVIVNGNVDKALIVWSVQDGIMRSTCPSTEGHSDAQFVGGKDQYVLCCERHSKVISLWYIGTTVQPCTPAIPLYQVVGHSGPILTLQVCKEHNTVITASADNTLKMWSLSRMLHAAKERLLLSQHIGIEGLRQVTSADDAEYPTSPTKKAVVTTCLAVDRSGDVAAAGTDNGWVLFYDTHSHTILAHHRFPKQKTVKALITSQDGRSFISAGRQQPVVVWNAANGKAVHTLEVPNKTEVNCLAESNGILVVGCAGMECYGHVYDINEGKFMKSLKGLYGFSAVAITSDGKRVVSTMFDYPIIYDVDKGEAVEMTTQPDTMMSGCTFLAISPDDKLVVACSTDGSTRVSEVFTGLYCFRMQHSSSVVAAAFSPDSTILITAGFRNLLVWSMKTGTQLQSLSRHQDFITQVAFSANGKFLLSCSNDKQIIIWDFLAGSSITTFFSHCPVARMALSENLNVVAYAPENVDYVAVLKPNPQLSKILEGRNSASLPSEILEAQAFAFAFSSQRVKNVASRACTLL